MRISDWSSDVGYSDLYCAVRSAAAAMAEDRAAQSGRLPDQRLPLELLRHLGRQHHAEHQHDRAVHDCLRAGDSLGIQDRISTEGLTHTVTRQVPLPLPHAVGHAAWWR